MPFEYNAFEDARLTSQLEALEEPSLWLLSRKDQTAHSVRFLWMATGQQTIAIRISGMGDSAVLRVAKHDGHMGIVAKKDAKLILDKELKLTKEQWNGFVKRLDEAKFWDSPTNVDENNGIADGDTLHFEGTRKGKYHLVLRVGLTSSKEYKALCRYLFELAKTDDLKAWDHFRSIEK